MRSTTFGQSTALSYLPAGPERPNFAPLAGRRVDRVRIERGRATGAVLDDGSVIAADQAILAAGAYGGEHQSQRADAGRTVGGDRVNPASGRLWPGPGYSRIDEVLVGGSRVAEKAG